MHSNAFVSGHMACDEFNNILNDFRTGDEFKLEENVNRDDLSKFLGWAQISAEKHAAGDDTTLFPVKKT